MEQFKGSVLYRYSIAWLTGLALIIVAFTPIMAMADETVPIRPQPNVSSQITITVSPAYTLSSGIIQEAQTIVSNVVSYTTWLSASTQIHTETFSIMTAPVTYAASLPRPMANVGYTIESMQTDIDSGKNYSMNAWASLFGYLAAIPVQLTKMLYQLATLMGPFGLFISWLFLLLPFILGVRLIAFIKGLIIGLINLVTKLIGFVFDLIKIFV